MTESPECEFCEIVAREEDSREVLRTEHVVAFFPLEPATLGHTLVVPRVHFQDIWALDEETSRQLADATLKVAHALRRAINPEGLNVIQSNGDAATQTVMHFHIHLVPRRHGDGMGRIWPPETHWTEAAKDDAWAQIRAEIRS
jgi:histidine triad (HIT) family protein